MLFSFSSNCMSSVITMFISPPLMRSLLTATGPCPLAIKAWRPPGGSAASQWNAFPPQHDASGQRKHHKSRPQFFRNRSIASATPICPLFDGLPLCLNYSPASAHHLCTLSANLTWCPEVLSTYPELTKIGNVVWPLGTALFCTFDTQGRKKKEKWWPKH